MKNQKSLFAMCCIVASLAAGCGSSPSSSPFSPASINGVFADAPVVGLSFACGTQTGVTGAGGTFTCPAGGTVTFSVGGITVCAAPAQPMMTPLSCAQATDPSANASTPSVIAVAQFLISISTTPPSSGSLTITSGELQAAQSLKLNFSTATQADLQNAVSLINPGATLVTPVAAQTEITSTVLGTLAGKFAGTFSGGDSGTWSVTIASDGTVSGTATNSKSKTVTVSGNLVSGTTYSGTAGSASWTGSLDTSKSPVVFSGTWTDTAPGTSGTFTGTKQ